jgi:hypothetical protein
MARRQGQMIIGHYNNPWKYFVTKGDTSCDNKSGMACYLGGSPDSGNGLNAGWNYAVVVPAIGKDKVSGKKTIIATTHDWSFDHYDEKNNWIGSHKHCFMKAIRLPNNVPNGAPIAAGTDLNSSLVQHVMGSNDRCVGYGGNGEGLPKDGTVMTDNPNFPSWHSTTIPHRFMTEGNEDAMLMSWRGSSRIVKVPFVRSSVAGVGEGIITGSSAIVTAATLPRAILGFNYRFSGTNALQIYYCATNGLLYKYEGGIETPLTFPTGSGITCHNRGKSIEWNNNKTAFYFIYTQNGLTGIGEYYVGN